MPDGSNPLFQRLSSFVRRTCWIGGCIITLGYAPKYLRKVKNWEVLDPSHHIKDYKSYTLGPVSSREMGFKSSVRAKQQKEWDRLSFTLSVITATSAAALAIPPSLSSAPLWFTTACFSAGFGLSLEGLIIITYLTVFASGSSPETIGRVAKGKHILKGSVRSTAFVTALPTAITTYASLFLLAGLFSMTLATDGKGVQEYKRAYRGVVLGPVGLMFVCCVGAVLGCEAVAANEARTREKRMTDNEMIKSDVIREIIKGIPKDEEAAVGMSRAQIMRQMSDVQVAGSDMVLGGS